MARIIGLVLSLVVLGVAMPAVAQTPIRPGVLLDRGVRESGVPLESPALVVTLDEARFGVSVTVDAPAGVLTDPELRLTLSAWRSTDGGRTYVALGETAIVGGPHYAGEVPGVAFRGETPGNYKFRLVPNKRVRVGLKVDPLPD